MAAIAPARYLTPGECLRRACDRFDAAETAAPSIDAAEFALAGRRFRVRTAGRMGERLATALAPSLRAPGEGPVDTEIRVWDGETSDVPAPEGAPSVLAHRVRSRDVERADALVASHPQGLSLMDHAGTEGLYFVRDATRPPMEAVAAPLLVPLYWSLRSVGHQVVHGAAVACPERGAVLVVGPSGAGKSTTALACCGSPLRLLGDDYVLIATSPGGPRVHALYRTSKVARSHRSKLPRLASARDLEGPVDDPKVAVELERSALVAEAPIRAIAFPRVWGEAAHEFSRLSAAAALRALAPSTLMQLPGAGGADFARMGLLAGRLPAFELRLGPAIDSIPDTISRILDAARVDGGASPRGHASHS